MNCCHSNSEHEARRLLARLRQGMSDDRLLALLEGANCILENSSACATEEEITGIALAAGHAGLNRYARVLETRIRSIDEALASADEAKRIFLANVSREMRTPLSAILGFAEMLCDDLDGSPSAEAAYRIRRSGDHLLQLIDAVLELSRIEAGNLPVARVPCSLPRILEEVELATRVRASDKGLTLSVERGDGLPETIHTDPLRLRRILLNLAGNAVKFTEKGSIRIAVRILEREGGHAELCFDVADTGIGITREQIHAIFDPFSQADTSLTRRHGGLGLGLTLSQRLAQLLGGEITVASEPGMGSTFTLRLPAGSWEEARRTAAVEWTSACR